MTDSSSQSAPLLAPAGNPSGPSFSRLGSRKKASTACSACRSRRSKCTGGIPCVSCVSHRTECIKDESEDGRRRVAVKRKLEALEIDRYTLDNLVAVLKHGSQAKINALINLVRTDSSRQDLRDFLDDGTQGHDSFARRTMEQQHRRDSDAVDGLQSLGRRRTGGIGDLINPPIQVPAKPWTVVTDDDDFVSHLISLWFTWVHPCLRWVEEKDFIEAMQSQNLKSLLCTPYLVNSILAEACLLDSPDTKENSYHSQLRTKFLAEARDGVDAEQGRVSLAMVQATGVLWTNLYLNGQDRMGRIVVNTHIFLAKGLDKWRSQLVQQITTDSPPSRHSPQTLQLIDRSVNHVRWTHYSLNAFNLADYYTVHELPEPKDEASGQAHEAARASRWSSYPLQRGYELEFHPDCHFRALVVLAQRMAENEAISKLRERGEYEGDKLQKLGQALDAWPGSLPSCLTLHIHAMPHVLVLHALYNWVLLVLAKQAAAAQADQPSNPVITATPQSRHGLYWRDMALAKAVTIAEIFESYKRNWSSDYFPPLVMQSVSIALLTLLEDLDSEVNKAAFITLGKYLRAVSRKFRVAKGVIQVIKNTIRDKGIHLPAEAEQIFDVYERRSSEAEASSEASSRRSDRESSERDMTVDYLLEKWEDLNIDIKADEE